MIKIGFTTDYEKRLAAHRASKLGVAVKIQELCVLKASQADEGAIHSYFAKHLVAGEQEVFHPHEEVTDYIRWLRDQYFVWVPDDDKCAPIADCDAVEPSQFLPNADRRKTWGSSEALFGNLDSLYFAPRIVTADDFYTNPKILDAAREALGGGIDLDPASHAIANREVKAARIFTRRENGLGHLWHGRVWLNPPFSEWQEWVPKIISEWASGRVEAMCVLCATRTLTAQYFSPIHENASGICILTGRIPFWGGYAKDSPDDGHAIFYFGKHPERFAECFGRIGNVFLNRRVCA